MTTMDFGQASYDEWVDNYELVYGSPEIVSDLQCPSCRCVTLNLRFVVRGGDLVRASAAVWCSSCLRGVFMAPCAVPPGGSITADGSEIPDYALLPPPGLLGA